MCIIFSYEVWQLATLTIKERERESNGVTELLAYENPRKRKGNLIIKRKVWKDAGLTRRSSSLTKWSQDDFKP